MNQLIKELIGSMNIISIKILAGTKTVDIFDKQGMTYICKEEYIVTIDFLIVLF